MNPRIMLVDFLNIFRSLSKVGILTCVYVSDFGFNNFVLAEVETIDYKVTTNKSYRDFLQDV